MTSGPFSHAILGGLFADEEVGTHLSGQTMLHKMIRVEVAYTRALGETGVLDRATAQDVANLIEAMQIDIATLRAGMGRDGVSVPALVREIKANLPEHLHCAVHAGMTSQDVIDTSLCLSLDPILALFDARLDALLERLSQMHDAFGANPLQGRTRMQAALPITVADRVSTWARMVTLQRAKLPDIRQSLLVIQLGGPVGTRGSFKGQGAEIARHMSDDLNLGDPGCAWHTNRIALSDLASWSSSLTGILGKFGNDIALMAQQGIGEAKIKAGGGSSAMPHKSNPILAELLVTLAQYNATQLPGMHQALIHEQERSGSAWALECMILPAMMVATGRAILAATEMCDQIVWLGDQPA